MLGNISTQALYVRKIMLTLFQGRNLIKFQMAKEAQAGSGQGVLVMCIEIYYVGI